MMRKIFYLLLLIMTMLPAIVLGENFKDPKKYLTPGRKLDWREKDRLARDYKLNRKVEQTTPYLEATKSKTRERILLNGIWEISNSAKIKCYQPLNKKVQPDPYKAFPEPSRGYNPPKSGWYKVLIPSAAGHQNAEADPVRYGGDWYRTSFKVPADWKKKKVFLHFNCLFYEVSLFINGRYVNSDRVDRNSWTVNITPFIKVGAGNKLDIKIKYALTNYGKPWKNAFTGVVRPSRLGILDDVWLIAKPEIYIKDAFIKTSWRKKTISVDYEIANESAKSASYKICPQVIELNGDNVLKLHEKTIKLNPTQASFCTLAAKWNAPREWHLEDPHLYVLKTDIYSKDGKLVDTFKERFGFREAWIDKGDFRLNGRKVQLNQYNLLDEGPVPDRRDVAANYKKIKAMGFNLIRWFDKPYKVNCQVADELGIYLKIQDGWHHPRLKMSPAFKKDADKQVPLFVKAYRNNPSTLLYCSENEAFNSLYKSRKYIFDLIKKHDPTKNIDTDGAYHVYLYDGQGKLRKDSGMKWMKTYNPHYPCEKFKSLIRTMEHPVEWSKIKDKPLFYGEWGYNRDGNGRVSRPAKYYHDLFSATLNDFDYVGYPYSLNGVIDYLEYVVPFWSRMGVASQSHYSFKRLAIDRNGRLPAGYKRPLKGNYYKIGRTVPVFYDKMSGIGARKFFTKYFGGMNLNTGFIKNFPLFILSEKQKRYSKIFRPFYAFFPDMTSSEYSGKIFKRKLCVLNRSYDLAPKEISGTVFFKVNGSVKAKKDFSASVPQGEYEDIEIFLKIPRTKTKLGGKIEIELNMSGMKWGAKNFKLDVFPILHNKKRGKVFVYDNTGKTIKALRKLNYEAKRLKKIKNLSKIAGKIPFVIGYHSLDKKIAAASEDILKYIDKGGRVICLSQKAENGIKWLPVKTSVIRQASSCNVVINAPQSGLFKGISNYDMSFWPNDRGEKYKITGRVSQAPYKKIKKGRVQILLESGAFFKNSPLMLYRRNKGIAYLSQLKIIPVSGISPVADLLLTRMISGPVKALKKKSLWYAGSSNGLAIVKNKLGFKVHLLGSKPKYKWSKSDIILFISGKDEKMKSKFEGLINKAIDKGATFVAFAPAPDTLSFLKNPPSYDKAMRFSKNPYVIHPKRKEMDYFLKIWRKPPFGPFIKMALADYNNPLVTGISNSDLFRTTWFRNLQKLADFEVEGINGWKALTKPGVISSSKEGQGTRIVVTAIEGKPETQPLYRNIIQRLLTNLGAVSIDSDAIEAMNSGSGGSKFHLINLQDYCNMGFADNIAGDKKGGFSDQGKRDLSALPTGKRKFFNIPFMIIKPQNNNNKSCIELGFKSKSYDRLDFLPRKIERIIANKKARYVYFLVVGSYLGGKDEVGYLEAFYPRYTEQHRKIPLIAGTNIADWSSNKDLPEAVVAWSSVSGIGASVNVYMFRWKNPLPQFPIKYFNFVGKNKCSLGLIAITFEQ